MIKCSQCGGTNFDKGELKGYFYDKYKSKSDNKLGNIPIDAHLCLDCGHIEIFAAYPELIESRLKKRKKK